MKLPKIQLKTSRFSRKDFEDGFLEKFSDLILNWNRSI